MGDEDLQLSELEEEEADSPPSTELDESDSANVESIEIPEIPRNAQDLEAVYDIPVQVSVLEVQLHSPVLDHYLCLSIWPLRMFRSSL